MIIDEKLDFMPMNSKADLEEKIRQNEMQLEKICHSMAEGVILWNAKLRFVRTNPEVERIFKQDSSHLEGYPFCFSRWKERPAWEIIRPDRSHRPDNERPAYRAIKEKREIRNVESGIKWPHGEIIWIEANSAPIFDESGGIEGVVTTITDVTELKRLREEKEQFTRNLIEAQEAERKRFARELHDMILPHLANILNHVDNLMEKGKTLSETDRQKLVWIRDNTEQTIKDIRIYSHELHPGPLDYLGLKAALESLVDMINENSSIKAEFRFSGVEKRLSEEIEVELFRIAQEALDNVKRHSQATGVIVHLKFRKRKIDLSIIDNGKGFDINQVQGALQKGGMGIISMQERANLIGSHLEIKSGIDQGTTISVELGLVDTVNLKNRPGLEAAY